MNPSIEGLVESSLNLGAFLLENGKVTKKHLIRSSVNTYKNYLFDRLEIMYNLFGGKLTRASEYPAWEYREKSILRPLSSKVYKELFKKTLKIEALNIDFYFILTPLKFNSIKIM